MLFNILGHFCPSCFPHQSLVVVLKNAVPYLGNNIGSTALPSVPELIHWLVCCHLLKLSDEKMLECEREKYIQKM